jgi:mycofactocin radical SAM maturase
MTWEITWQCNLHCAHCLSDAGAASPEELSTRESKALILQLADMKVFQVNIGGGEPFIRKDFLELLTFLQEKGIVACVSTNGMLMDDELAKRLTVFKHLYLQVSLDGVTEEVNDRIRGQGTYLKILSALGCLSRQGFPYSINMVLTKLNYSQLDSFRELAREYRAGLRVSRFRPSGRGKDTKASLGPTPDQLEAFADWLTDHDQVRTGDSFFCLTSENRRRKGLDMCGAGKMTCCLSPSGDVYPCAFLQEKVFQAGNVRSQSLKQLWDQAAIFRQLRELDVSACHSCLRFETCRGGCPAMAYHTYGDVSLPDPECLANLKKGVTHLG